MADCSTCQPETGFYINGPQLPGVPVGRMITPLVRINGQVQDLPIGMTLPASTIANPLDAALTNTQWLTALKAALNNVG